MLDEAKRGEDCIDVTLANETKPSLASPFWTLRGSPALLKKRIFHCEKRCVTHLRVGVHEVRSLRGMVMRLSADATFLVYVEESKENLFIR